jgi:L-alanine-DL-glutamate epimerase-like enolase superfamily enzyme
LKITKIECIPITVPYKKPTEWPVLRTSKFEVIVKVYTDEGVIGVGETGEIAPGYLGDGCQDSIIGTIHDYFGPMLLGEDPFNVELLMAKIDRVARGNNQAKAVIDFALHDIVGKALNVPLYRLIGGLSLEKIPLSYVLAKKSPDENAKDAVKYIEAGFKSVKLKVGWRKPQEDIAVVKAVRDALGNDARIMIDANCAWDFHTALCILKKLERYDLVFAEQPIPYWDVDGLKALRFKQGIPIAADEATFDIWDLLRVIKAEAADVVFIKVVRVGGILKAQKWASIAKAADLPAMCGCMVGGGIEAAAQAHFLASNEWMGKLEHENLGPLITHQVIETAGVKDDIVKNPPKYEKGYLYPPSGPGLGVELNEEIVNSLLTPGKKPIIVEKRK